MHRSDQSLGISKQLLRTRYVWSALVAFSAALTSCAPAARQSAPAPTPTPTAAVLRLLDISPSDGSRVDSTTVLVARLAYVIPDHDPQRRYLVSAMFAQVDGRLSSVGSQNIPLQAPFGIVTFRGPMQSSHILAPRQPVNPLTGVFFLFRHDSIVGTSDTTRSGNEMRVRTAVRSTVQARSRTFYFNGSGPARSLAEGLPAVLEEYWTFKSHKALAVAYDSAERWTYGYAFGHRSTDTASQRALEQCKAAAARRQVVAPCQLVAKDDEGVR